MDEHEIDAIFDDVFAGTPTEYAEDTAEPAGTPTEGQEAENEVAETGTPTESNAEGQAEGDVQEQIAPLKFQRLGKEVELTKDELRPLTEKLGMSEAEVIANLQKGAEYDHKVALLSERTGVYKVVADLAKAQGRSVNEVMRMMSDAFERAEKTRIEAEVRTRHPEADEATLREMVDLKTAQERMQAAQRASQEQAQKKELVTGLWRDFFSRYPDVKPEEIPDDVKTSYLRGISPAEAYLNYRLQQQSQALAEKENLLKTKEQEIKNRSKSVGSVAGDVGGQVDDVFASFDSAFN